MALNRYTALGFIAALLATPAQADHTAETPTTDGHAYTLRANEFRLGAHTLEVGLFDEAEVGVAWWLWALKVKNGFAKVRLYHNDDTTVSVSGGYLNLNTADLQVKEKDEDGNTTSEPNLDLFSATAGLNVSHRWRDFTWSGSMLYAYSGILGDSGQESDFGAALIGSTGTVRAVIEYRLGQNYALELASHVSVFELANVEVETGVQPLDSGDPPRATLEIFGSANIDLAGSTKLNGVVSLLMSYPTFNMKLGLGYGHLYLPLAGVFISSAVIPIPALDLYWRF